MMQNTLSLLFLSVTMASVSLAQAPTAAPPPTPPDRVTTTTAKAPAMAMPTKKTTVSREVPDTYKGRILTVGSGGGVRGQETAYYLLDDGRLFGRKPGQTTYVLIGQQTPANTKKVFQSVEDRCAIRKTAYNKPGNTYRFIGWKRGVERYRVAWAPADKAVPPNYNQVYTAFLGMIPASKR